MATPLRVALVVDAWFDGERRHDRSTLRVEHGRLAGVDSGDHGVALAAQGWSVERLAFVMPGLVDAHVHLFLDGSTLDGKTRAEHLKLGRAELTAAARRSARDALDRGVTLVRDAGDRHGINHALRAEAADPCSGMAAVRSAGLGVKRARRYGGFMATDVDDAASIRGTVRDLAESADEIKLILTGIIDFDAGAVTDEPQFDAEAARLVVDTAHACGRHVMAHCSGAQGLAVAVTAGVDSIEHGFFMSRETLARMRDQHLAWTPTFSPVHFQWAHPEAAGWSKPALGHLRRILDDHAEHLRLAHEMGVTLLLGTDAGSMGVPHGLAVHDEMCRFVDAGLPVDAVLRAASSAPRRHFGMPPSTLEVGAPFDALALGDSPWVRFDALARPLQVWRLGLPLRPAPAAAWRCPSGSAA